MRRHLSTAALILLLAATAARADSNADEADQRFRRGAALFKAGHYEEALLEFFSSNRLAHNRNVVFNIARSYEALGRFEEAYRYYAEYGAEESDATERASAERKLAELAPRVALLRIESTPPGATVYLERKDLGGRGETPLIIAVPPGTHTILLERAGYAPATLAATAERGREVAVSAPLELIVGTVRVTSKPVAASVYVDRVAGSQAPPAGRTPVTLELTPGRHTVELEAADHRSQRADVMVRADALSPLDVTLEARPPPSGTVVLASKTAGALVLVDGEASGFTPAVLSLTTGAHDIEVRGERLTPWHRRVRVDTGARLFYDVELDEAEQEVTAATRSVQTVSTAPASVTLVTRDEIWAFGYQTLPEAVRAVRGVYASDDRNYEAIGVRGFSRPGDYNNRVLLLRDGHVMNDDWTGAAAVGRDFSADLDDVDRVEIVRGPGSTFYGPGAFFGVIQVVSREPGVGAPVRAGASLSSDGGGVAFARGAQRLGPAAVSIYASAYDSAGETLRFEEFEGTPSGGEVRGADGEDAQRAGLRAAAGDFALDAGFVRRRKGLATAPYETVFDPENNDATGGRAAQTIDRRGFVEARWEHRRGPLSFAARGAYDVERYDGVYPYDDGVDAFVFTDNGGGDWWTGEARASLEHGPSRTTLGGDVASHIVTQGFDEDDDGTPELDEDYHFVNGAGYLVEELRLGERAILSAGARMDFFGLTDDTAFSPRVGAVLTPYDGGTSKLVVGRAFRAASVYELFYNDGGITQLAPESLDPETIWTAEVEHTHTLAPRTYLIGSVFASRIQDLIRLGENEDAILVFENSRDDTRAAGGELELRVTARSGAWTGAGGSFTQLDSDDQAVEVNSAAAVGFLRGFWPALAERLGLAAELVYNGPRPMRGGRDTGHTLLGRVFASGRIADERLWYRVGVTNALDWDWSVPVGEEFQQRAIQQPDRAVQAQLVYQLE